MNLKNLHFIAMPLDKVWIDRYFLPSGNSISIMELVQTTMAEFSITLEDILSILGQENLRQYNILAISLRYIIQRVYKEKVGVQ